MKTSNNQLSGSALSRPGFALGLALASGALLPVQVAFNTTLGNHAGGAIFGALASFIVGLLVISLVLLTGWPSKPDWRNGRRAPLWAWLSGLAGGFYVSSTIVATPAVGLAVATAATIAGQLSSALIVDHFSWIGFSRRPVTVLRLLGALLLLAAVLLLVQSGSQNQPQWAYAGLSFMGGVALTVGLGMNNTYRQYVGSPVASTFINFFIGAIALGLLTLSGVQGKPDFSALGTMPAYGWFGGMLGATYVTLVILAAPVIGASLTSAAVIAGQVAMSLLLDQLGLFDLPVRELTMSRLLGLAIMAAGVWAVQHTKAEKVGPVPGSDLPAHGD